MHITVKGKHFDVTDALNTYASDRLNKISRYFDSVISADVTLSTERNWHIAEVTVFGNGFDMRGEERTKDMYNSIDRVIEKLERQLKKKKAKVTKRRPSRSPQAVPPAEMLMAPEPERESGHMDSVDKFAPRVDLVKSYRAYELTIDEAIKQMEAKGHEFFAFLNADNDRINVIYKRKRGYGLVDPRIDDGEE